MPHIRLRAVQPEVAARLSQELLPALAQLTQVPVAHYTLELIPTQYFAGGRPVAGEAFCEVLWFDRGAETEGAVAKLITDHIRALVPPQDVVVVFTHLVKSSYFENGSHF